MIPPDQRALLESELLTHTKLQTEALEDSQFVPMTADETLQYERRAARIAEIRLSLGVKVVEG
ncbi:MAG TPA: hypothetical protein VFJ47_05360 [Terriglobales bacterium]|nr:hypothetical protein [Terriglobales bacterium]